MKKYFYLASAAVLALASCSSEDYVGGENPNGEKPVAIAFGGSHTATTRATEYLNGDAATRLDNNYVVEGIKYDATSAQVEVFDHYNVNYGTSTANSTLSNSSDWEYVGQNQNIKGTSAKLSEASAQTIKYWDYAASQYDFVAVSLGKGATGPTYAKLSEIDYTKLGENVDATGHSNAVYTLTGTYAEISEAYVADLVSAYKADGEFGATNVITPKFRRAGAKVRIGFYDQVPGYAVTNIKFYTEAWAGGATAVDGQVNGALFTANPFFVPTTGDGVLSVYYPIVGYTNKTAQGYNQAVVKYEPATSGGATLGTTMEFGAVKELAANVDGSKATTAIGLTSATASYAGQDTDNGYVTVIPQGKGENLQIRVEYDLYPTDGGSEVIHVRDACAVVPAQYANWKSNYAYTYIFKISDATNGWTGVGADGTTVVEGLTPITFDAVVVDTEDAMIQETITSVSTNSITTYALGTAGVDPTGHVEYNHGQNIYVSVAGETLTAGNVNLYKATATSSIQPISEAAVANALAHGGVTELGGGTLTVNTTGAPSISIATEIAAADRVDRVALAGNYAVFKPTTAGTYVFEYVKVAGSAAVLYTQSEIDAAIAIVNDGAYVPGSNTEAEETATKTAGDVKTPAVAPVKWYKVIIVY